MGYHVTLSGKGQYILCRIEGVITRETVLGFTKEVHDFSLKTGVKRLLHDVRQARNALDPIQNYMLAYHEMPDLEIQRDVLSAVLINPDDNSHDFVETVSLNAGFTVRLFDDEATAIRWLTEDTPSETPDVQAFESESSDSKT